MKHYIIRPHANDAISKRCHSGQMPSTNLVQSFNWIWKFSDYFAVFGTSPCKIAQCSVAFIYAGTGFFQGNVDEIVIRDGNTYSAPPSFLHTFHHAAQTVVGHNFYENGPKACPSISL